MRNQNTYEYRLITLLVGLLVFVILVGGIIFYQLNTIAFNVQLDRKENQSLLLMKDIQNDLILADNLANSYALLKKNELLNEYDKNKNRVINRIILLKEIQPQNSDRQKSSYSVHLNILKKYQVLDQILNQKNELRVTQAMDKVIAEIDQAKSTPSVTSTPLPTEKKTLRERLKFNKKETSVSSEVSTAKNDQLTQLNKEIKQLSLKETKKEQMGNESLYALQDSTKTLTLAINELFTGLENKILKDLEYEVLQASRSSKILSYVLIIFSILVAALIAITLYSIFLYINKNNVTKRALEEAKLHSDELAKSKERFLANMSHEIRTPLHAISGFSELLSKENMPPTQKNKIDIIRQSSQHLTDLINHILDLTKLQSNKMTIDSTPFLLSQEMNWIANVLKNEAEKRESRLILKIGENVPDNLIGDPMKIKQIVLNLCSNAVKFTERGEIELNIQAVQVDNKHHELRFRVTDTGIGISEDKQKSIFDEFEQAEKSTQRQYGGTGLGLSITKKLVELLDGKIYLKSKLGQGTTITVHILVEINQSEFKEEKMVLNAQNSSLFGKNVLIVDDEPFNRKLLATLLNQYNVFTVEANNGKEAIEKIQNDKFDLVFMDLRMPIMDGKAATEFIRRELKISPQELNIIALTANKQLISEKEYLEIGFNACMEKPFTEQMLSEVLLNANDSKNIEPMKEIKLYDLSNLKKLSGDDGDFFEEMVLSFMNTTAQGINQLKTYSADNKWDEVAEIAHKLASPCAHLEATRMHTLLRDLENNCRKNENIDTLPMLIAELNLLVESLIAQMSKETGIDFKLENN